MTQLSSRYNPKETEDKWTSRWKKAGIFHAQAEKTKSPFSIVIPPPNITGILHMGHAYNNTLQDILIRYKRMQGYNALWMPGTDHAGIATQNVVEKQLTKEGKSRHDIGRQQMLERLWAWKQQYGDTIIHQLERLGASCDWERTRFTMDDHYSRAVKTVFIKLFEKGLVYRGRYIINWCPRCQTALSDEEAEHQNTKGKLYHIRYPFKDQPDKFLTVATTRPETMLGDTAVAVNPKDPRYKNHIGKTLVLPLLDREIPVIRDDFVDPEFGTGAVKVTPAHDPNDFAMGQRHELAFINIMNPDASLNDHAGPFAGMDRFKARQAVVKALEEKGLLVKIEEHTHAVGHCYRCDTMVEPYLSQQWFVKMKPLAEPAIAAVNNGEIKFHPQRWTKVYLNWMENIRDWCISRQIWWGHRIPVWYCDQCPQDDNMIAAMDTPAQCPRCGNKNLTQDEDVLDTWFSSWLWPFATLHWPEQSKDLDYFYPTSVLITASEIIFFWVARMIMAGYEFTGKKPFSDVFIHGTVRDAKGVKMSKSLGNTIDPLEIIDEFGADALRFSLIINSGQDLFISREKFEIGRNFANKLWNASRLILMNVDESILSSGKTDTPPEGMDDLPSRWIVSKLNATIGQLNEALDSYRFSEAETILYDFFWRSFCDWYLEILKDRWRDEDNQAMAVFVLKQCLLMLHPFMPYITEEIWHTLHPKSQSISLHPWPEASRQWHDAAAEEGMAFLINLITSIRNVRAHWNVDPKKEVSCLFQSSTDTQDALIRKHESIIRQFCKLSTMDIRHELKPAKGAAAGVAGTVKYSIPLSGIIDLEQERNRLAKQIDAQTKQILSLSKRLESKGFLQKAPEEVVAREKERLKELQTRVEELKSVVAQLS